MTGARDASLRLRDMLDAVEKILGRSTSGRAAFLADEMLQVWVIHHLEIIGEAAANVDRRVKESFPEVDWIAAAYTRNRLVHGYYDVNLEIVWKTVERDIPTLRDQLVAILQAITEGEDGP